MGCGTSKIDQDVIPNVDTVNNIPPALGKATDINQHSVMDVEPEIPNKINGVEPETQNREEISILEAIPKEAAAQPTKITKPPINSGEDNEPVIQTVTAKQTSRSHISKNQSSIVSSTTSPSTSINASFTSPTAKEASNKSLTKSGVDKKNKQKGPKISASSVANNLSAIDQFSNKRESREDEATKIAEHERLRNEEEIKRQTEIEAERGIRQWDTDCLTDNQTVSITIITNVGANPTPGSTQKCRRGVYRFHLPINEGVVNAQDLLHHIADIFSKDTAGNTVTTDNLAMYHNSTLISPADDLIQIACLDYPAEVGVDKISLMVRVIYEYEPRGIYLSADCGKPKISIPEYTSSELATVALLADGTDLGPLPNYAEAIQKQGEGEVIYYRDWLSDQCSIVNRINSNSLSPKQAEEMVSKLFAEFDQACCEAAFIVASGKLRPAFCLDGIYGVGGEFYVCNGLVLRKAGNWAVRNGYNSGEGDVAFELAELQAETMSWLLEKSLVADARIVVPATALVDVLGQRFLCTPLASANHNTLINGSVDNGLTTALVDTNKLTKGLEILQKFGERFCNLKSHHVVSVVKDNDSNSDIRDKYGVVNPNSKEVSYIPFGSINTGVFQGPGTEASVLILNPGSILPQDISYTFLAPASTRYRERERRKAMEINKKFDDDFGALTRPEEEKLLNDEELIEKDAKMQYCVPLAFKAEVDESPNAKPSTELVQNDVDDIIIQRNSIYNLRPELLESFTLTREVDETKWEHFHHRRPIICSCCGRVIAENEYYTPNYNTVRMMPNLKNVVEGGPEGGARENEDSDSEEKSAGIKAVKESGNRQELPCHKRDYKACIHCMEDRTIEMLYNRDRMRVKVTVPEEDRIEHWRSRIPGSKETRFEPPYTLQPLNSDACAFPSDMEDKNNLLKAAEFLQNEVIPSFITALNSLTTLVPTPADLVVSMKGCGIPTYYLGRIASECKNVYIIELALREMLVRCCLCLIRDELASIDIPTVGIEEACKLSTAILIRFLNIVLGCNDCNVNQDAARLWTIIEDISQRKFGYVLKKDIKTTVFLQSAARMICDALGATFVHNDNENAMNIDFSKECPFDVTGVCIMPIVQACCVIVPTSTSLISGNANAKAIIAATKRLVYTGILTMDASTSVNKASVNDAWLESVAGDFNASCKARVPEYLRFTDKEIDSAMSIDYAGRNRLQWYAVGKIEKRVKATELLECTLSDVEHCYGPESLEVSDVLVKLALQLKSRHEENGRPGYSDWNRSAGIPQDELVMRAISYAKRAYLIRKTLYTTPAAGKRISALKVAQCERLLAQLLQRSQSHKEPISAENVESVEHMHMAMELFEREIGYLHPLTSMANYELAVLMKEVKMMSPNNNPLIFARTALLSIYDLFGSESEITKQVYDLCKDLEAWMQFGLQDLDLEEMIEALRTEN